MQQSQDETEKYLTIEQVMERLQVSRDTVSRLIKKKKLRAKRVGRVYRISEQWLRDYMNEGEVES